VHTLSPWYERLEQSIDVNLLTQQDADNGVYAKFVEEGLLRGALKDTASYLTALTAGGIMLRNEARAKLDMNPVEGLDEPLTPANTVIGAAPEPPQPEPDPAAPPPEDKP
jgi:phage portal protein BeeE